MSSNDVRLAAYYVLCMYTTYKRVLDMLILNVIQWLGGLELILVVVLRCAMSVLPVFCVEFYCSVGR